MARRLGRIVKRGERWLVRSEWIDEYGRRRSRAVTVDGSRKDAERELAKLAGQIERGGVDNTDAGKLPLDRYLAAWIQDRAGLGSGTRVNYERQLRVHISPRIGHVAVRNVRRQHLERLLLHLTETGLSAGTIHVVFRFLLPALREAYQGGSIPSDPTLGFKRRGGKARQRRRALSAEEARQLLAIADQDQPRIAALVAVLLFSGLRPGEAIGLRRRDVDLRTGWLRVEQAVADDGHHHARIGPPKTPGSKREIVLPEPALVRLRAHLADRGTIDPDALIFPDKNGDTWGSLHTGRILRRLLRAAGIEGAVPYSTRHTAATQALQAGVPLAAVAAQLGHVDASTTLRSYAHTLPGHAADTAAALAKALLG